ncbi:MAG: hypothetical protein ABFD07_20770 [Methanobacterium sp.]
MSKIAFVSGWYNYGVGNGINEKNQFILQCLYDSGKKYFLSNHDVEFIFITNTDAIIDNVTNIKIDDIVTGFWPMCLMKVLTIKYLEDKYDYIFVNDTDQIFTDYVTDEILNDDMTIVEHFFYPSVEGIHDEITQTDKVTLNFDRKKHLWTMGNFFGGKSEVMRRFLKFTEYWDNEYRKLPLLENTGFYTKYPEEYFLIKFIYENNIQHNRLLTTAYPNSTNKNYFLSDFQDNETIYPDSIKVKLLHNTKKSVETLRKIIKYYI